jgi:hypothetical protein
LGVRRVSGLFSGVATRCGLLSRSAGGIDDEGIEGAARDVVDGLAAGSLYRKKLHVVGVGGIAADVPGIGRAVAGEGAEELTLFEKFEAMGKTRASRP